MPFRPARVTPRPIIHGVQTAVVVGKKGEELWVDKHGRVKVQFFWDREGKRDENSSCWVRVSQNWAGKRWGAMFLPRIGLPDVRFERRLDASGQLAASGFSRQPIRRKAWASRGQKCKHESQRTQSSPLAAKVH